jgi:cytochrome c553
MLRHAHGAFLCLAVLALPLLSSCGGSTTPGLARGQQLYDTCVPCHGEHGEGSRNLGAPAIAGLPQWYLEGQLAKFRDGVRGAHPEDVEGARMRPMARTLSLEGDVTSVAQYVASLPEVSPDHTLRGGNAQAGAARYQTVCMVCHGNDGRGMEPLKSPSLVAQADWYMLAQLNKFKTGMRGAHPQDITGGQMRAMAMTLESDQAVLDVIAYIQTLKR